MAIKAGALTGMVTKASKKWTKQKKAEERTASARLNRWSSMKSTRITVKDAAYAIMEDSYNKVSKYGALPASARQIMYAARGYILAQTGDEKLDSNYFRKLLKDYIQDNYLEDSWDVTFDDRGTLHEPHTKKKVPQGTLQVRAYLNEVHEKRDLINKNRIKGKPPLGIVGKAPKFTDVQYPTVGAENRFSAVMLVEKEGFMPLFDKVKLANRYDIAILANKGQSVDATRRLVDTLCSSSNGVPLYIVRDFDVAGFSISATVCNDTEHYTFENMIDATDLGLRLDDVEGLEDEPVFVKGSGWTVTNRLKRNGATDGEVEYLAPKGGRVGGGTYGRRVELNAFTSEEFIDWLEGKFEEHGIEKVIPGEDVLDEAYRRAFELECYQSVIEKRKKKIQKKALALDLPDDLEETIRDRLDENPELSWDDVINEIVKDIVE